MILAAGLGTRLRPLTANTPKPLIQVAGKALIDYALDQLKAAGLQQVVVNGHYLVDQLQAHLKNRTDLTIDLMHEAERLETGGGIANALPLLGDQPFISMNSDTICLNGTASPITRMINAWNDASMDVLMVLFPTDYAIGYDGSGDFVIDKANQQRFRRRQSAEIGPYVFTGMQMIHPRLFHDCPDGPFSMNLLYDRLKDSDGWFNRIGHVIHDGNWLHVGDPAGLKAAEHYLG